jgi:hypothetical protein
VPPFQDFEDELLHQLIFEERQKLPIGTFVDFGQPLPSHYGVDQLQLMVQSPYQVFAHWELTEASVQKALQRFPSEDRSGFQVSMKWIQKGGAERFLDVGTTSNWWFPTQPEVHYQVELGLYSEDYGWVALLVSPEVLTPRATLGPPPEHVEEPRETLSFLEELVQWTGIAPRQEPEEIAVPPLEESPREEEFEPKRFLKEVEEEFLKEVEEDLRLSPEPAQEPSLMDLKMTVRPTSAFS